MGIVSNASNKIATRQERRKSIEKIIKQIEEIMNAEFRYAENMPENLKGSIRYEAAEEAASALEEAIDILSGAY